MRSVDALAPVHYTYVHRRASDGSVFYVGKGKNRRAWSKDRKNRHWHNIVNKHGLVVEVVKDGMPEACALALERIFISIIGRENLTNLTDGGEGGTGYRPPPETRAKMSAAKKGKPRGPVPQWVRDKISASHMGLKPTKEALENMSKAKKGRFLGRESPSYKHEILRFEHIDGSIFEGTRGDFILQYGMANGCVSSVISGRQKTVRGWKKI